MESNKNLQDALVDIKNIFLKRFRPLFLISIFLKQFMLFFIQIRLRPLSTVGWISERQ